jgi:hypothetical protein
LLLGAEVVADCAAVSHHSLCVYVVVAV